MRGGRDPPARPGSARLFPRSAELKRGRLRRVKVKGGVPGSGAASPVGEGPGVRVGSGGRFVVLNPANFLTDSGRQGGRGCFAVVNRCKSVPGRRGSPGKAV